MPKQEKTASHGQRETTNCQTNNTSRRRLLHFLGASSVAGLAGCFADEEGGAETETDAGAETETDAGAETETDTGEELQKTAIISPPLNIAASNVLRYNSIFGYYARALEPLVRVSQEMKPVPWLAKDWERTGQKTWEFTLRENVTYHNGDSLTPDLVISAYNQNLNEYDFMKHDYNMVPGGLKKIDDMTIEMTTVFPSGNQPAQLHHAFSSLHHPDTSVYEEGNDPSDWVGTGPYKVEEVKPDQHVKLSSFDDYWGGNPRSSGPHMNELKIRPITDNNTRALALAGHRVDVGINLPVSQFESIKNSRNTKVATQDKSETGIGFINLVDEPTSDIKFRKALNYAVSQKKIVDGSQNGLGIPARGIVAPVNWTSAHDSLSTYGPNKEKAEKLVEQSSYNGETIQYVGTEQEPRSSDLVGQIIQQELKEIGVDIEINLRGGSGYRNRLEAGDGHLFVTNDIHDTASNVIRRYVSPEAIPNAGDPGQKHITNIAHTQPEVQERLNSLVGKAFQSTGLARKDPFIEAQHLLIEEATAVLPLFHPKYIVGMRDSIEGVDWHPLPLQSRIENLKYFK